MSTPPSLGAALLALGLAGTGAVALGLDGGPNPPEHPAPWGYGGHAMATRVAAATLPAEMPAFFRGATEHLVYLAPEPDRWRVRSLRAMDEAWAYDHYIDFENVPAGARRAADRWAYLDSLYSSGLARPARDGGFLPWRILELYQRLASSWSRWRAAPDGSAERAFLEARILDDAGILGHYVADGSQPHHTTVHFDGWSTAEPNPEGFSTERGFHSRFERFFVDAHVSEAQVRRLVPERPRSVAGGVREEIWSYLDASFDAVPELYRIDRELGFDPGGEPHPRAVAFATEQLAAGSAMLAALWWSAWLEGTAEGRPGPPPPSPN